MTLNGLNRAEAPVMGVDIGGTKTEFCLGRYDGGRLVKLRERVLPSQTWRSKDIGTDAQALMALVVDLAQGDPIAALGVGAHGCDDDPECDEFTTALRAHSALPLRVVNDAELMPLAMGRIGQIGLVAGTGSIAVCRDGEDRMISAGGWGWLIGDDGSAAGLVREAARAISLALDAGASTEDPLIHRMYGSLGNPNLPRLGSALAAHGSAAGIGAHAPAIFEALTEGSPLAASVILEGGNALAKLVLDLQARGSKATHVVAGGSVIVSQPALWQAFVTAIERQGEGQITAHLFDGHPVDGACRLAARLLEQGLPTLPGSAAAQS